MIRNDKMKQQLQGVRGNVPAKTSSKSFKDPVRSPQHWVGDNVDHINISSTSESELGRLLSHRWVMDFDHSHFGRFNNLEAFDLYILSQEKDDRLRRLHGAALKNFSKKLNLDQITNFKAIVLDTQYQRIKQNAKIRNLMTASTLPFDVYYTIEVSKIRIRPTRHHWLVAGLNEIRTALKEQRDPDFTPFMDNVKMGIYDNVLSRMGLDKPNPVPKEVKAKPVKQNQPGSLVRADEKTALLNKTVVPAADEAVAETAAPLEEVAESASAEVVDASEAGIVSENTDAPTVDDVPLEPETALHEPELQTDASGEVTAKVD